MRDLQLKHLINVATAASCLASVVGCGGSKDEEDGANAQAAIDAWCDAQNKCDPGFFDSLAECESYVADELDYAAEEGGPGCEDALIEFFECYGKSYSTSCDYQDVYDDCELEYDAADDVCF